jgi:hypothetical protein
MTKLRRILLRAPKDAGNAIKVEVAEFAKRVESQARRNAGTGNMASMRYSRAIGTKIGRAGFSADVGLVSAAARKSAWFAHFIEYGTKAGTRSWKGKKRRAGSMKHPGTTAHPVIMPAFEHERPGMEPRIRAAITRVLNELSSGPDD